MRFFNCLPLPNKTFWCNGDNIVSLKYFLTLCCMFCLSRFTFVPAVGTPTTHTFHLCYITWCCTFRSCQSTRQQNCVKLLGCTFRSCQFAHLHLCYITLCCTFRSCQWAHQQTCATLLCAARFVLVIQYTNKPMLHYFVLHVSSLSSSTPMNLCYITLCCTFRPCHPVHQ